MLLRSNDSLLRLERNLLHVHRNMLRFDRDVLYSDFDVLVFNNVRHLFLRHRSRFDLSRRHGRRGFGRYCFRHDMRLAAWCLNRGWLNRVGALEPGRGALFQVAPRSAGYLQ